MAQGEKRSAPSAAPPTTNSAGRSRAFEASTLPRATAHLPRHEIATGTSERRHQRPS
jgi:hypothetical protein